MSEGYPHCENDRLTEEHLACKRGITTVHSSTRWVSESEVAICALRGLGTGNGCKIEH